jgi:CheY-like chemotaxis protein
VDKVSTVAYDLVLMDMQMPVLDGLKATREIRKEARFKDLPIVAMTANAKQSDRDRCIAAGMNDHLAKPIEPEYLWQMLLKWIKPLNATAAVVGARPQPIVEEGIPSGIEGLDVVNGLHRLLGKKPLYLSLLRKFVVGQKSVVVDIKLALRDNSWDKAELLVHTLKGVCASIGATSVQSLAEDLEAAVRARRTRMEIDALLDQLKGPLANLIEQLEQQLPKEHRMASVTDDPHRIG